jgi:hypothetical protein
MTGGCDKIQSHTPKRLYRICLILMSRSCLMGCEIDTMDSRSFDFAQDRFRGNDKLRYALVKATLAAMLA